MEGQEDTTQERMQLSDEMLSGILRKQFEEYNKKHGIIPKAGKKKYDGLYNAVIEDILRRENLEQPKDYRDYCKTNKKKVGDEKSKKSYDAYYAKMMARIEQYDFEDMDFHDFMEGKISRVGGIDRNLMFYVAASLLEMDAGCLAELFVNGKGLDFAFFAEHFIADTIDRHMKEEDLTPNSLSELLYVSKSSLYQKLGDISRLEKEDLDDIADVLGFRDTKDYSICVAVMARYRDTYSFQAGYGAGTEDTEEEYLGLVASLEQSNEELAGKASELEYTRFLEQKPLLHLVRQLYSFLGYRFEAYADGTEIPKEHRGSIGFFSRIKAESADGREGILWTKEYEDAAGDILAFAKDRMDALMDKPLGEQPDDDEADDTWEVSEW